MRVAIWQARGRLPGAIQILRQITGPQRWRVRLMTQRPDGQRDDHIIRAPEPVSLGDMRDIVLASIDDLTATTELADARMDFFVEGRA